MIALAEFSDVLSPSIVSLIEGSLRNATVGNSYRVGGIDGDNLYPAYSNPSLMGAVVTGFTGRRLSESNMTAAGEIHARQVVDLFDGTGVLSEFNSPTYTGISLWALTLQARYMPSDSVMGANAARMILKTWEAFVQLYHPEMKKLAVHGIEHMALI